MTTLVVGASGATGKQLVKQLLDMGQNIKVIVRSSANIPDSWKENERIQIIRANVLDISKDEMAGHLKDCGAVASCLGHNMTRKGIFGEPRKLVTDAVRLLCEAIEQSSGDKPVKFVLMNTAGNTNRDINESVSLGHKVLIGLIRLILPPQSDNEKAADFLRLNVGQNSPIIEWVAVRPDSLIDEEKVTDYKMYASPTRSALFNPVKTSRINVAHVMAKLIVDSDLWNEWKGQMPVVYNQ
ncbi:MAG: NAD(P)-dependent oxidoreductase [Dysgonomonas sp.]